MRSNPSHSWLASGLLLGSTVVLYVLMLIPQSEADRLTYVGLFGGLVLALASLATFGGLQIRRAAARRSLTTTEVGSAHRQGIEVAVLATSCLFLLGFTGLSWWEAGLLVAGVIFAEVAFSLRKNPQGKEL